MSRWNMLTAAFKKKSLPVWPDWRMVSSGHRGYGGVHVVLGHFSVLMFIVGYLLSLHCAEGSRAVLFIGNASGWLLEHYCTTCTLWQREFKFFIMYTLRPLKLANEICSLSSSGHCVGPLFLDGSCCCCCCVPAVLMIRKQFWSLHKSKLIWNQHTPLLETNL